MTSKSFAPTPPEVKALETSNDMKAARLWADAFRKVSIPREAVELSFSRSSGPGGQVKPFPFLLRQAELMKFM